MVVSWLDQHSPMSITDAKKKKNHAPAKGHGQCGAIRATT
jgi:hypothetical protein